MDSEALIPPEDWVTHPNPGYDESCPTCSSLVENRAIHREWHIAIVERADRHVPAPRYGGG